MPELLEIDGVDLRGQGFGAALRAGRYSLPARRGSNQVVAGASGALFVKNRNFEEGFGSLQCWAIGAASNRAVIATNLSPGGIETVGVTAPNGNFIYGLPALYGNSSALITTSAGSSSTRLEINLTNLLPNTTYTTLIWYRVEGADAGSEPGGGVGTAFFPQVAHDTIGVISNYFQSINIDPQNTWLSKRVVFTTPSNYVAGTVLRFRYYTGKYRVRFDGFMVVEGNWPDLEYFDGFTPNLFPFEYVWTGTAFQSTSQKIYVDERYIPPTRTLQRAQLESNLARLMRLFTRGHKLSTMRAGQPDGTIRRALVEWSEWSDPEIQAGGTRAEFAISYTIPGVWWEDEAAITQNAEAGSTLPKILDMTAFANMTGIVDDGVLTVVGPITNPRVTDLETGAYVEYQGTVASGASWVVDSLNFTSRVNGASVVSQTRHAGSQKFFTLSNGYNGTDTPRLTLTGSAGGAATNFGLTARRKWATG